MRVLHVTTGKGWRGGEQQVLYLLEGLARLGVAQELVCTRGGAMQRRAAVAGVAVHGLAMRNEVDPRGVLGIARRVRRFHPDVLHLHTSQAHGLGALAARLCGRRRPAVVVTRRVDYSIFRHSFLGLDRFKYVPGADLILCVSEKIRDVLRQDGLPAERLAVARSGVDLRRFEEVPDRRAALRAEFHIPLAAPLIGNVAHLAAHKGQRTLILALPALLQRRPDAWCVIVGEGELEAELRALAKQLGVSAQLVFTGFRQDVLPWLRAMDVFCFPSNMEGLGTSVLDALAMERAVVATTAGGIPEIIESGVHGVLVPPGDPAALCTALLEVLEHPDRARALAAAGQARVRSEFSVERTVAQTLAAYQRL